MKHFVGLDVSTKETAICVVDDAVLNDLFESLLSVLSGLKDQRLAFDRQLARFAREDETCQIVSSAPSVGSFTAIAFVTAVDDPVRFRSAWDVGAYLGLTHKRYQSGEVDSGGRISKAGDRLTRKLLFEAATAILYRASSSIALKQWGLRVNARSGSWKAGAALARKLAVTLLTMWKTSTMFENRSLPALDKERQARPRSGQSQLETRFASHPEIGDDSVNHIERLSSMAPL